MTNAKILLSVAAVGAALICPACGPDDPTYNVNLDATDNASTEIPYYPTKPPSDENPADGFAPAGYKLVWSDEFSDRSSLARNWYFEEGATGWGNNELQYYCPGGVYAANGQRTAEVVDGELHITAYKVTPSEASQNASYVSTRMNTTRGWKYGYVEMRAKLPKEGGTWPAFWMLLKDGPSWVGDGGGELDIMEWVGNEPEKVHFSCHSKNVTAGTGNFYTDPVTGDKYSYSNGTDITNPSDDYHCFGMEWTHEYIKAYLDGVEYYYAPNPIPSATDVAWWPFDQEYYIKLNLAIGGSWGGTVDPAFTSATFAVDWVRVYQK